MNNQTVKYQSSTVVGMILLFTGAAVTLHFFKVPTIMGDVATSLNMSTSSAPWLMSVFTLIGIFGAIPSGYLVQKYGPKTMVITAALCVGIGSIIGGSAADSTIMLISRAIEGIGYIIISIAAPLVVVTHCNPANIGGVMGIWAIWVPVGQIMSFNLTPFLFKTMSWNKIWMIYAVLTIIMAVVLRVGLRKPEGLEEVVNGGTQEKVNFGQLLSNKNLMCVNLSFIIFNYFVLALTTFLPGYLTQAGIMGTSEAAFVATIPMITAIIGSPILGKLSETRGRKKIYIIALIAAGLGMVLVYTSSISLIYLGAVIFGLIGMSAPGAFLTAFPELVNNPKLEGAGMGIVFTCVNLGQFLGTATFLPLARAFGGEFTSAALATIPLTVIGIVLAIVAKFK